MVGSHRETSSGTETEAHASETRIEDGFPTEWKHGWQRHTGDGHGTLGFLRDFYQTRGGRTLGRRGRRTHGGPRESCVRREDGVGAATRQRSRGGLRRRGSGRELEEEEASSGGRRERGGRARAMAERRWHGAAGSRRGRAEARTVTSLGRS